MTIRKTKKRTTAKGMNKRSVPDLGGGGESPVKPNTPDVKDLAPRGHGTAHLPVLFRISLMLWVELNRAGHLDHRSERTNKLVLNLIQ